MSSRVRLIELCGTGSEPALSEVEGTRSGRAKLGRVLYTVSRELKRSAQDLQKTLEGITHQIDKEPEKQGFNDFGDLLNNSIQALLSGITSTYDAPTQASKVKYEKLRLAVQKLISEYTAVSEKNVSEFRKKVQESGFSIFKDNSKVELKE